MLWQGRSIMDVVAEPAPGLAAVHDTVKGVVFCGIHGGQVAEAGLERGRVCSEAEAGLKRGVVSSQGSDHALLYAHPIWS
jgi:hypothetical protein